MGKLCNELYERKCICREYYRTYMNGKVEMKVILVILKILHNQQQLEYNNH